MRKQCGAVTAFSYFREVSEQRGVAGRAEKTQEDISVQGVSQKLAFEDIHAKLDFMEDPQAFLDRLRSMTDGVEGNKKDASEIARAIDLLLSRVQQLESHQDSADAERSDAASIDVMVDAKILAVARKVEALDSAVERLAVRLQPFELGTYMSLLNTRHGIYAPCVELVLLRSNGCTKQ